MWQQLFMGFLGLCAGIIVASGVAGLLIGLSIIPRYAGITRTADHVLLYEDMSLLGIVLGNLFYLFRLPLPAGNPFLMVLGVFSGFFLEDGSWLLPRWRICSPYSPEESGWFLDFPLSFCSLLPEN